MKVIFVHGWSVTHTNTYGGLPAALAKNAPADFDLSVSHLHLAKYVSFADEVKVDDIARGMEHALRTEILPALGANERFACITHSTGGPVVRAWVDLFYGKKLAECPLSHLVMLAPANHGSALAQLGKGKLSRLKSFLSEGVEPGVGVLDWLELGSEESWALNTAWLKYDCVRQGLFPFVLTGQRIDRSFYDNLNSYTDEAGSDGVVRVAAANLNYGLLQLKQTDKTLEQTALTPSKATVLGVLPGRAHSGDKIGIMRSVKEDDDGSHPTLHWVIECLKVNSPDSYRALAVELDAVTTATQVAEKSETVESGLFLFPRTFPNDRHCMFVVRIHDDRGNRLSDYEVLFTAGPDYNPNHLPPGFFTDRQLNSRNRNQLTYYLNYDKLEEWFTNPNVTDNFGFRIVGRPVEGYVYYVVAEHKGTFTNLKRYFAPNKTLMVDIELRRHVTEGVYRLTQDLKPASFSRQPKGDELPPGI